jgi:hypothetical protein
MSRASKEVREKWIRSVKRVLGTKKEVRYVGSHRGSIQLTLEIASGVTVPATIIRDLARTVGLTDKNAIDRLVRQSRRSGPRVIALGGQRCDCFTVVQPHQPPIRYCLLCQQTPPYHCREHPSCR